MSDSRKKRTQQHKGDLQIAPTTCANILTPCPWCFLCIYMHIYTYLHDIYQRLDNTRVGANCNSPFHMGAIENMGELNYGRIELWANCITYSAAPARGLCPYDTRKKPHANINDQWLITSVHWPLFTDLCSLFTLHSSLFTDLSPPTSILISHNDSSWLVHQKCCTFASNLKQVLGVSLRNPNTP